MPQDSILGLWKIAYDNILGLRNLSGRIELLMHADYLPVAVQAKTATEMDLYASKAVSTISELTMKSGLEFSPEV